MSEEKDFLEYDEDESIVFIQNHEGKRFYNPK